MAEKIGVLPDENVYYNVNITNTTQNPILSEFNSNARNPIIQNGREYTMSIVRFYIPGTLIPIFHFDANPVPYIISLGWNGYGGGGIPVAPIPQNLIYDNTWNNTPINKAVWNYQQFLTMMNVAFTTLSGIVVASGGDPTGVPQIFWDTQEQLFKIKFSSLKDMKGYVIYFNNSLYTMFPTFPGFLEGFNTLTNLEFRLANTVENQNNYGTNYQTFPPTQGFFLSTEDNCQYAWNGLVRVLITSGTINSRSEFQYAANGVNVSIPIITDFDPSVDGDFRVNNVIQYYPQGELRRIDLTNDSPLTKIDFKIFYEDKWGNIYPLYLAPNQFISMKLVFQKRTATCQ